MAHLMTTRELAKLMGWAEHTCHQRHYRGVSMPPRIKLPNGTIRYRAEDVEAWLDEHTEAGDTKPAA